MIYAFEPSSLDAAGSFPGRGTKRRTSDMETGTPSLILTLTLAPTRYVYVNRRSQVCARMTRCKAKVVRPARRREHPGTDTYDT